MTAFDPKLLLERLLARRRVPASTYRLQLRREVGFREAGALVPYLDALGVTDVYTSPFLLARPGSSHGYDICDHGRLNDELGTEEDFAGFVGAIAERGMGHLLDFVSNHMGIDPNANRWWRDVLENGPSSPFARFFDIDWDPVKEELKGRVLLPILADQYGVVLENGELRLALEEGTLAVRYGDRHYPINPRRVPEVFGRGLEALAEALGEAHPHLREFLSILTELRNLPRYLESDPERVAERQREKEVARERLTRLLRASEPIRRHVEGCVAALNGEPGHPETFDGLHDLLEMQPYRLAFWQTALHEINYRRFFDVNDHAGLRMEDEAVFQATHGLVLRLVGEGKATGLRIDHVDGLFDPAGYLDRLQEAAFEAHEAALAPPAGADRDAWLSASRAWREARRREDPRGPAARPLYVVAEKVLSPEEELRRDWALDGTTGYDFLNAVGGLFVSDAGVASLRRTFARFAGRAAPFADVLYESKKLIMLTSLASELNVLAHDLNRISEANRRSRDFTLNSLRQVLLETVACFPVYRTYVDASGASPADRRIVERAIAAAKRRNPAMEASIFEFLRAILFAERGPGVSPDELERRLRFARKFQQYTGPVQAKGLEDTAFYRFNALLSLNEVGGDAPVRGVPPGVFHEANRRRRLEWPHTLCATATHDTKRGEDARARLHVLSETPDAWRRALFEWGRINARHRTLVEGDPAPDRNDECLYYQALLGSWPPGLETAPPPEFVERLRAFMAKATREAKVHTSWVNENRPYEEAVARFVDRTLAGPGADRFLGAFLPFQRRIACAGVVNSLVQVALKVASPGVPDLYQGAELWDLSLVDPDNRRIVDFAERRRRLEALRPLLETGGTGRPAALARLLERWEDGSIKMFVTASALRLRRRLRRLFLEGDYLPLAADPTREEHVVAFARSDGETAAIAAVPRLVAAHSSAEHPFPLGPRVWGESLLQLSEGLSRRRWRDLFTGAGLEARASEGRTGLSLAEIFSVLPVAILLSEPVE